MSFDASFFVAVAVFLFIALVYKPLAKVIGGGLDRRSARIKSELEEAQALKEEAQALVASYQRKHREALEESEKIIEHAKREAENIIDTAKAKVESDIKTRTDLAKQKIAQAEMQVVKDIKENAVDITVSAAKSLIVEHLNQSVSDELVKSAISDINQKLH